MTVAPVRTPLPQRLRTNPIIAVLRAREASACDPVIDALIAEGVVSIELTLTTPGTIDALPSLLARVGDAADVGVGTVTSSDHAQQAIDAGAAYLVTPITQPEIIATARAATVPVIPGGLTPTELFDAWQAGASAVKVFPAQTVGHAYGAHLRGPFPEIEFIPSGGVTLEQIPLWLNAGAVAVSLGGPLLGDALAGGSLAALRERARTAVELTQSTGR